MEEIVNRESRWLIIYYGVFSNKSTSLPGEAAGIEMSIKRDSEENGKVSKRAREGARRNEFTS